ncbi:multidrug resistance-associated 4-like, partial [Paramuricea clavata]
LSIIMSKRSSQIQDNIEKLFIISKRVANIDVLDSFIDRYDGDSLQIGLQEIKFKAKRLIISSVSFSFSTFGQQLSTFVTIMVLTWTDKSILTPYHLITMMLLFANINDVVLFEIPLSTHFTTNIIMALTRIQRFLESYDFMDATTDENRVPAGDQSECVEQSTHEEMKASGHLNCTPYVWLDNVSCNLPTSGVSNLQENSVSLLKDISFKISSKGLVIITGSVGSGKSSLLACILNKELRITKGTIKRSGNIAYVSDKPWVFPGTIRQNILFGSAYDEKWYLEIIEACQLEKDLKGFPELDLSRIGEHGATLSGGQRARLALARAVYSRADIYLMDDPLSSLDAKIAENIFKNVLKRMLSERIVFLVTHKHFNEADYIIMLDKDVRITETTKYFDKLQKNDQDFNYFNALSTTAIEPYRAVLAQGTVEELREAEEDRQSKLQTPQQNGILSPSSSKSFLRRKPTWSYSEQIVARHQQSRRSSAILFGQFLSRCGALPGSYYLVFDKQHFNSAMDIKRLMSQAGSPLYSHFSNTMEGLRIIRVHNRQKEFTKVLLRYEIAIFEHCWPSSPKT